MASLRLNPAERLADTAGVNRSSPSHPESVRVSEILSALSFALDLTEGQPLGHSLRTCLIGMAVAERLGLPLRECRDLYYASMLKDVGCSSSSARIFELFGGDDRATLHQLRSLDWGNYLRAMRLGLARTTPGATWFHRARRIAALAHVGPSAVNELVQLRSERAAAIVRRLGFGHAVAEAVRSIDERWDGTGQPRGLRGGEIPIAARIISVAHVLEVFSVLEGPIHAHQVVRSRHPRWYDPTLLEAASGLEPQLVNWCQMGEDELRETVRECEPGGAALLAGPGTLDNIALGFAEVVDAKSPYTAKHSFRVTELTLKIAARLGYDEAALSMLRRAALLHDIGKLSVPNSILDKPGRLNAEEWDAVRLHPFYTKKILDHIAGFEQLASIAAAHHERLDGRGYYRGLRGVQIPRESQIIATADIYDALSAARPYRPAMSREVALATMEKDRGIGLLPACLDSLNGVLEEGDEAESAAA